MGVEKETGGLLLVTASVPVFVAVHRAQCTHTTYLQTPTPAPPIGNAQEEGYAERKGKATADQARALQRVVRSPCTPLRGVAARSAVGRSARARHGAR